MRDTDLAGVEGPSRVPPGGSAGQVLQKTGAADYQAGWVDPSSRLAEQERMYISSGFTEQTITVTTTGWQSTRLAPEITVPALGAPPTEFKWLLDIGGLIRILPPASNVSIFYQYQFNRAAVGGGVDGGGVLFASAQGALPVASFGLSPPSTTANFTVNFYFWVNQTGEYRIRPAPYPSCRAYLVKV